MTFTNTNRLRELCDAAKGNVLRNEEMQELATLANKTAFYQDLFLALIRDIANGQMNLVDVATSIEIALEIAGIEIPEKEDGDYLDYQDSLHDWCEANAPALMELRANRH